jgi:hypothetical protein
MHHYNTRKTRFLKTLLASSLLIHLANAMEDDDRTELRRHLRRGGAYRGSMNHERGSFMYWFGIFIIVGTIVTSIVGFVVEIILCCKGEDDEDDEDSDVEGNDKNVVDGNGNSGNADTSNTVLPPYVVSNDVPANNTLAPYVSSAARVY